MIALTRFSSNLSIFLGMERFSRKCSLCQGAGFANLDNELGAGISQLSKNWCFVFDSAARLQFHGAMLMRPE